MLTAIENASALHAARKRSMRVQYSRFPRGHDVALALLHLARLIPCPVVYNEIYRARSGSVGSCPRSARGPPTVADDAASVR